MIKRSRNCLVLNLLLKTFFILFFLGTTSVVFSQPFRAGLSAGLVASQVDGDTYAGYNKSGLYAGGFVSKRISPESKWTVLFELTYIQKGSRKIPHPDKGDYADYKLKLNYAEIPLLAKYDFSISDTLNDKLHFALFGGLAFGRLVKSKEWDAFGLVYGGTPFLKTDISYVLGLSYSFSQHIDFDIRTQYSVFPVRKGGTSTYYPNWTNNFLRLGYYNSMLVFALKYAF